MDVRPRAADVANSAPPGRLQVRLGGRVRADDGWPFSDATAPTGEHPARDRSSSGGDCGIMAATAGRGSPPGLCTMRCGGPQPHPPLLGILGLAWCGSERELLQLGQVAGLETGACGTQGDAAGRDNKGHDKRKHPRNLVPDKGQGARGPPDRAARRIRCLLRCQLDAQHDQTPQQRPRLLQCGASLIHLHSIRWRLAWKYGGREEGRGACTGMQLSLAPPAPLLASAARTSRASVSSASSEKTREDISWDLRVAHEVASIQDAGRGMGVTSTWQRRTGALGQGEATPPKTRLSLCSFRPRRMSTRFLLASRPAARSPRPNASSSRRNPARARPSRAARPSRLVVVWPSCIRDSRGLPASSMREGRAGAWKT